MRNAIYFRDKYRKTLNRISGSCLLYWTAGVTAVIRHSRLARLVIGFCIPLKEGWNYMSDTHYQYRTWLIYRYHNYADNLAKLVKLVEEGYDDFDEISASGLRRSYNGLLALQVNPKYIQLKIYTLRSWGSLLLVFNIRDYCCINLPILHNTENAFWQLSLPSAWSQKIVASMGHFTVYTNQSQPFDLVLGHGSLGNL